MRIVSFKGFDFEANDYTIGIHFAGGYGQWAVLPQIAPRRNEQGELTGATISERAIAATIGYDGALSWQEAVLALMGHLNPLDTEPGELIVETNAGDDLVCDAIIVTPGAQSSDVNMIDVTFLTTDPLWRALTETTVGPTSVDNAVYGGITPTIAGSAPVHGTVRLTPTAADQQVEVRTFSVTNSGDRTMVNFPVRVDFGNNYDGMAHPSYYFALLKDGVTQRCQLIDYYGRQAYLWLVVEYLPPGETADYTFLISTTFLMPGTTFNSYTKPTFDIDWFTRATSAISTTTVHTFSGVAWEVNQWRGGTLRALTGALATEEHTIISNTATTITTASFAGALASGVEVLVTMSLNGKWVYPVRQTERSGQSRGLWYLNQGQKKPGDARFDVPGAWSPYLYYDNNDEKVQRRWTGVDVGTFDYFSILDASRTWEGAKEFKEEGGADGVSITMPFPITHLKFDYQLKNPNGMATFVLGSREAGGADSFVHEVADDDPYDTLTNISEQTTTLSDNTIQLYLGLIPTTVASVVQDEIGTAWAGDEGTASSGSVSQLNDNTKDWISDQFIGGSIRIVSGTGAGQQRAISDNSPNTITPSVNFSTAPDSTSRYQIKQKPLVSNVRTNAVFEMTWDATDLDITTPTAAVDGYILNRTLYLDRATASADPPYQRFQFDADDTGRYIVLMTDETFVIDGARMRAWIEDASGEEVRSVPPRALLVHDVEADGTERLAERWIWLTPGAHTLMLTAESDGNDYDVELAYTPAVYG